MNHATRLASDAGHHCSLNRSLPPTPQQSSSVLHLKSSENSVQLPEILNKIKVIRTIWSDLGWLMDLPTQNKADFAALLAVSSADDDSICEWFRQDPKPPLSGLSGPIDERRHSDSSTGSSYPSSLSSRKYPRNSSGPSTARSSVQSFEVKRASGLRNQCPRKEAGSVPDHNILTQALPESIEALEDTQRIPPSAEYRCLGGDHDSFTTKDMETFKRHEMELHVNRFYCFSKQTPPKLTTHSGTLCILCGTSNPDDSHFQQHNLQSCLKKDNPQFFRRKGIFEDHLKTEHKIPKQIIKVLVQTSPWWSPFRKTAFSCGLCIGILFDKKEDQLEHLKSQHFENGQGMNGWDATKIIRSLLRHPEVNPAWREQLLSTNIPDKHISWDNKTVLRTVLTELDLSSITAKNFASMALALCSPNSLISHLDDTSQPLQITKGQMKISTVGFNQVFSSPLHMANPDSEMSDASHNYSQYGATNEAIGNDAMDLGLDDSLIPSNEFLENFNHSPLPPRSTSLPQGSSYFSQPVAGRSFNHMQLQQRPPTTAQPLQCSMEASQVTETDTSQGLIPDQAYGAPPPGVPFSTDPDPLGSFQLYDHAYPQPQQWSHHPLPPGSQGTQSLSTSISNSPSTSGVFQRKVSAQKSKVDGSKRRTS